MEALREADRIIVFKEGTIVEEGTHEALMAKEGEYYRLYAQQLDEPLIGVAEEGGDQWASNIPVPIRYRKKRS